MMKFRLLLTFALLWVGQCAWGAIPTPDAYYKLDESSGNAADETGNGSTLTNNNTATYTTGKINNGASFATASSQSLSCASNTHVQPGSGSFTIAFWWKATTLNPLQAQALVSKDTNTPANSRDFTIDTFGGDIRFYSQGGAGGFATTGGTPALTTGTWYYVVARYDQPGATFKVMVNNANQATAANIGGIDSSTAPFRIGASSYSGFENYVDGVIDEVGFWKQYLTDQNCTDLYNGGSGLPYSSFAPAANNNFFMFFQ